MSLRNYSLVSSDSLKLNLFVRKDDFELLCEDYIASEIIRTNFAPKLCV
jgi:hypothetical protein